MLLFLDFGQFWFSASAYIGIILAALVLAYNLPDLLFGRISLGKDYQSYSVSGLSIAMLAGLALVLFLVSNALSNSKTFKMPESRHAEIISFKPPVSTFLFSVALAFFLLSLINDEIDLFWKQIAREKFSDIDRIIGSFILMFFILIFVLLIVVLAGKLFRKKKPLRNLSVFLIFTGMWIMFIYLAGNNAFDISDSIFLFWLSRILDESVNICLGSIPLGWFYELFIAPLFRSQKS